MLISMAENQNRKFRLEKPTICLIVGVAGSGKSTLAEELAKKIYNGVYLSKDFIQDAFTKKERTGEIYALVSNPTFKILLNFADIQLKHGKVPIIDAPFNYRLEGDAKDWALHFKKIADSRNARLAIICCKPSDNNELYNRLKQRGRHYDIWKLDNFEKFLELEPINFPILHDDVHELFTDKTPEELAKEILVNYLNAKEM